MGFLTMDAHWIEKTAYFGDLASKKTCFLHFLQTSINLPMVFLTMDAHRIEKQHTLETCQNPWVLGTRWSKL